MKWTAVKKRYIYVDIFLGIVCVVVGLVERQDSSEYISCHHVFLEGIVLRRGYGLDGRGSWVCIDQWQIKDLTFPRSGC